GLNVHFSQWHECRPFVGLLQRRIRTLPGRSSYPPSCRHFAKTRETPDHFRIAAPEISFGCTYRLTRSYPIHSESAPVSSALRLFPYHNLAVVLPISSADVIDLLCCILSQESPIC